MPHLAPPTLTTAEQKAILRITASNLRDHTIFSMALGTGLRLGELVGLNVGSDPATGKAQGYLARHLNCGTRSFPPPEAGSRP